MWSNDEYYMLFSDTICDVVGPDIISDNDVAAELPDDNDKLFDMNKFINMNKGHNPGMGLNFHSMQA